MATRHSKRTPEEIEQWRCFLCERDSVQIGSHPLPVRQRAHVFPNRLTGGQRRYGGVKNALTEKEWEILLDAIATELVVEPTTRDELRKKAIDHCYDLCGECHEEVLSEPVYLPAVMESLKKIFRGKTRVEKILLLARALKLGTAELEHEAEQRI